MDKSVEFHGGRAVVLLPLAIFLFFAVYLFVFRQAFDMFGLAMGGVLGIFAGSFLAKKRDNYWTSIVEGMSSTLSGTVVAILLAAGIFSAMMRIAGVADGFVWLGAVTGITGAYFCAFTFVTTAVIATATGTSIGTIFAAVPIFFTAGVQLGADPAMLAGAVLSGAIFGDNLAPVSDVTVISASTQRYRKKDGVAEIGGVVASRFKYALAAALITIPIYLIAGKATDTAFISATNASALSAGGLIMLIPVAILIFVAIYSKNIFSALVSGIVSGTIVALLAGRFEASAIFAVNDGVISGFVYSGITNMAGTIVLVLTMFGVVGVFERSGTLQAMTEWMQQKGFTASPRGAELSMGLGSMLASVAFASVTSASLIMFGPVGDKIGAEQNIHPYRRSHIMSAMANSIPVVLPFSAFVFIAMAATNDPTVTPFNLFYSTIYPWALFMVFMFCMISGVGRRFEGNNGEQVKEQNNE